MLRISAFLLTVLGAVAAFAGETAFKGKSTAEWATHFKSEDNHEVIRAYDQLLAGGEEARPVVLELLASEDDVVRLRAVGLAVGLKRDALPLAPAVLALKSDRVAETRRLVCLVLIELGNSVEGGTEALTSLMADEDPRVSANAAYGYWRNTGETATATKRLVDLLKQKAGLLTYPAIIRLAEIGKGALPALQAGVRSDDIVLIANCCAVVSRLGPRASAMEDLLLERLDNGPKEAWGAFLSSLASIHARSPRTVQAYI